MVRVIAIVGGAKHQKLMQKSLPKDSEVLDTQTQMMEIDAAVSPEKERAIVILMGVQGLSQLSKVMRGPHLIYIVAKSQGAYVLQRWEKKGGGPDLFKQYKGDLMDCIMKDSGLGSQESASSPAPTPAVVTPIEKEKKAGRCCIL